MFHLAQHLTKMPFLVVNMCVSEEESRLQAEEGTEFEYQSSASKSLKRYSRRNTSCFSKNCIIQHRGTISKLVTSGLCTDARLPHTNRGASVCVLTARTVFNSEVRLHEFVYQHLIGQKSTF